MKKAPFAGSHCKGKTGETVRSIPCQAKHREFGNFDKKEEEEDLHVINLFILKIKGIVIFGARFSKVCPMSVLHMK